MTLEGLFVSTGMSRETAAELAARIEEACPWMDPDEYIGMEIGIDLLAYSLDADVRDQVDLRSMITFHNETVRVRHENFLGFDGNELYAEVVGIVSKYGQDDGCGHGDFWVFDESFSSKDLLIYMYKTRVVSPELREDLDAFLTRHPAVGSLSVMDEEGDRVLYEAKRSGGAA